MHMTQEGRFLKVTTPLGADAVLLGSFRGTEELSRLFEFDLELLSSKGDIDPTQLIGSCVSFELSPRDRDPRSFNGFVSRMVYGGLGPSGLRQYRATLVPWLWFLTKRSDCRIFQHKSVLDIVLEVFRDAGFNDFSVSGVSGKYPPYEYCVQYRETDFDFVSRLLEEEGIFYYFTFEEQRHVLQLADSKAAYKDCARKLIEYTESAPSPDQVSRWEHSFELVSGKWTHSDFNFTKPKTSILADAPTVVPLPGIASFERFEYPGRYADKQHGDTKVRTRMEEEEGRYDVVEGSGGCEVFSLAGMFELENHPFVSEAGLSFVIVSLVHHATEGSFSQSGGGTTGYGNDFRCIPSNVLFRPQRSTPRPRMMGPQTAMVVGHSGEEIHTDQYGRIKVQFHWDRAGRSDETSSCWMRVAQSTAGKKWGAQVLPRIGQEVVVDFLEGDPDRPLVTGAVYNADTMPPFVLPDNKTQSGFRTITSKKGAADAINELRFEDKNGGEHIFIRAQKDEHHLVIHDRYDKVGNEEHRIVVKNCLEKVDGDQHLTVKGKRFEQVTGAVNLTLDADCAISIGGAQSEAIKGDQAVKISGKAGAEVVGDQMLKVGMNAHRQAGQNVNDKAGMDYAVEAGMNLHIKGGINVVIEAGVQLTLKAGPAFVTLGPAGVDISGPMVKINSGGAAGSGGGCSPTAPSAPAAPTAPTAPTEPMKQ
jgi:type VI secretion system secreted protein VgrG